MPDTAIQVEGLSKRYRIGVKGNRPETFGAAAVSLVTSPVRNLRRLRSLSRFGADGNKEEDIIWALRDVSFEVKEGEIVGIVGRNGAGKSTLLKILSRITMPTRGRAVVYGRVSSLLEVGTGFHPELTGRENVYLNGTVLGMSRGEVQRKFDEIVDFSGVEKFIDTPVKRYSSGMQVRLAFAVAAHLEPEILLVDEVLAVGDAAFQKKCLGRMEDVASEGRTILFVSHNLSAVNRLCPRAILLDQGRVVRDGPSSEVTTAYLHGSSDMGGFRRWSLEEAEGSDELKLTSVALLREDGTPTSSVDITKPLKLRIGYYVGKPGLSFRCYVEFLTQGVIAFPTLEPIEVERNEAGSYYSEVLIPPNLFAEGEYVVRLSLFTSWGRKHWYAHLDDALAFQVYDPMDGSSARGDYAQNTPGMMRPRLEWSLWFDSADETATQRSL
jgi:lipopolysaccharide transport system ATP-binding protein